MCSVCKQKVVFLINIIVLVIFLSNSLIASYGISVGDHRMQSTEKTVMVVRKASDELIQILQGETQEDESIKETKNKKYKFGKTYKGVC